MPEGPEVKIITDQLNEICGGKQLNSINLIGGRFLSNKEQNTFKQESKYCTLPTTIHRVWCKGKFIYFELLNGQYLWNTLGMTGSWTLDKQIHSAIELVLDARNIYFTDPRHFGTFSARSIVQTISKLKDIGYDILSNPPQLDTFIDIISCQKRNICKVLMDQKTISGVGNYIKAESLYRAGISPWRQSNSLKPAELELLYKSIINVMKESYNCGGATLSTYKNVLGARGSFAEKLQVYGKIKTAEGKVIKKEETPDKRTTWWVPSRQK